MLTEKSTGSAYPGIAVARPVGKRVLMTAAALAALFAAIALAYRWQKAAQAEPHYTTAMVGRGTVATTVVSSGTINPITTVQVGTYVSGVIQSILCDFNTEVKAGQLCAKIDPRPYQTTVEQEAALLETARAQLLKDRANLEYTHQVDQRGAALLERGFLSNDAAENAHNAFRQAQAQLALDEASVRQRAAQLQAARINLGYTNIVSPVNGTVVSRNVTQGQTVAASFQTPTLFLIATDLTKMQVDTNVSESDIGRIATGNAATFTVASFPDRQFSGKVTQVRQAPQTVQNVVTYDVVVSAPNPALLLKPGMTASIKIVTSRADKVLRVPEQALRYRPASRTGKEAAASVGPAAQIWILADGKPRRVAVVTGLVDDSYAEIVSGPLREGDQVIVSERAAHAPTGPASRPGLAPPR